MQGKSNALEQYSQTMAAQWGKEMRWAQRLADTFYCFPSLGYRLGVKRPSASRTIGKILTGELKYSDVAQRAIKRLAFPKASSALG